MMSKIYHVQNIVTLIHIVSGGRVCTSKALGSAKTVARAITSIRACWVGLSCKFLKNISLNNLVLIATVKPHNIFQLIFRGIKTLGKISLNRKAESAVLC